MKRVNLWNTNFSNRVSYFDDIEKLVNHIKENKRQYFYVVDTHGLDNETAPTFFVETLNNNAKQQDIEINYFDDTHLAFEDSLKNLHIERNFFEQNKETIISAATEVLYEKDFVYINKRIYSPELVKNLILTAETICFEEGIIVPEEIKELLRKSRINSYVRKNGKKEEISSNKILGVKYESVVSDGEFLSINADIKDLENLKFIPENKTVTIYPSLTRHMSEQNLENIYNIVLKLRENNQENKVIIKTSDRKQFCNSKIYNSNFKNVIIDGIDLIEYSLEDLQKENELLDLMVNDIKNSSLSPFEKYIAVYNIVKKFKVYKENVNNKEESRTLNKFLNNEYMVCVGYAKLLEVLLEKVGISSYDYSVSTDTSYDDGFTFEEKTVELAGHARLIVNISDPKYNISGFFVTDPTWDNDLENDYYNHAIMSFDKTSYERRYFSLTDEELLLNCKDMEEYNTKVNFLMKKLRGYGFISRDEKGAYYRVVDTIKDVLKALDMDLFIKLEEKYSLLDNAFSDFDSQKRYIEDFITDAGYIFIHKLGKDVPLETVIDAASEVNSYVFGFNEEQKNKHKEKLFEENIKIDKLKFPYYYEENKSLVA